MSPRTGRPPSSNPKGERVEVRMNAEELEHLDACCRITGKSRSQILREGMEVVYTSLHDGKKNIE